MWVPSRSVLPAMMLTVVVARGAEPGAPRVEPEVTGSAAEPELHGKAELRKGHGALRAEKRPVRVILPSPYSRRP